MAETELDRFSRLLETLYGNLTADGGEEPWDAFLRELRTQFGATYATLILTPPNAKSPGRVVTPGAQREGIEQYATFFSIDPFAGLPEGKVVTVKEFIGEQKLRATDFYQQYLQFFGGDQILGVDLRASSGFEARIRINRDVTETDFGEAERATLTRLVPHIRNALLLFERLEMSRSEYAVYSGAVEQLAVGTVILDHDGNILRRNAIAAAILAEGDGIAIAGRRLALSNPRQDAELRQHIKAIRAEIDELADSVPHVVRVERPSGRRDLGVVVKKVETPEFMHTGAAPAVAVFISDPDRQVRVTSEALRELFDLTRSEATISACFANGLSLAETAAMLGIAPNTVRAHLRSVFSKTGVKRQSQLVHLVHTSLPELAVGRES